MMKRQRGWRTGYRAASEYAYRLFTIVLSLVFIAVCLPLFVILYVVVLAKDGLPVFYSGQRLGKNKKPFTMYKFRTLVPEANRLIGADLFSYSLSSNRELLNATGEFLRETRLDELPQLLNVLKGDMDLLGPRPIRPEFYEKFCREIPGFDKRFRVRPGLLGYAQLFTPHSSPARLRAIIDLRFLQRQHRYFSEIILVTASFIVIGFKLLEKTGSLLLGKIKRSLGGFREKRELTRITPEGVRVIIRAENQAPGGDARILEAVMADINEEAISLTSREAIPEGHLALELKIPVFRRGSKRQIIKTTHCTGRSYYSKKQEGRGRTISTVVMYTPASPLNYYLVHQYLMESSIVRP